MILGIILPTLGILLGIVGLIAAVTFFRATRTISRMHKLPTCSASAGPAKANQGIYIEHGMANEQGKDRVRAQHKLSKSFYDSLI